MIRVSFLLIFHHFFQNLILKVIWNDIFLYEFKLGHNFVSWQYSLQFDRNGIPLLIGGRNA